MNLDLMGFILEIISLTKIKDGVYVINLDEYSSDVTYFDSFGVEHIPKEIRTFITNKILKQIFSEYKHMIQ